MAVLNDIKRMQSEGMTDAEIIAALKQQGVAPREITEALTQSKIREAVTGEKEAAGYEASAGAPMPEAQMPMPQAAPAPSAMPLTQEYAPSGEEYAPGVQAPPQQPVPAAPGAEAMPAQPVYPGYEQPYQYAPQPSISPDTITEISEQVVSEKLSPLRKDIEKVLDMKTTIEAKTEYLDERLKRIEKIIDRLQLSILQKVGDYATNIEDIKRELIETQKSFKAASQSSEKSEKPKKPQSQQSPAE
jgi:hypothetical protein